jgi:DNA-binding NtrC family response regulator
VGLRGSWANWAHAAGAYHMLRELTELFVLSESSSVEDDKAVFDQIVPQKISPDRPLSCKIEEELGRYLRDGQLPYIDRVLKAASAEFRGRQPDLGEGRSMQQCAAWIQFCGCSAEREAEVRAELVAAGMAFAQRDDHRFCVVCFAIGDEPLFSLLQSAADRSCRVIAVATSPANAGSAWRLLEAGAEDALAWSPGGKTAEQICLKLKHWSEVDRLVQTALSDLVLIGESPIWSRLIRRIVEAAYFSPAPILITGESGTGKEALATLVSKVTRAANASRGDLVTVDCGTLAPELSGSEFFGHERGAFTGAYTARDGAFALADGATLFLDEIGDISLPLQPQILRCIQEQTYKRLGSNVWQKSNFRLVSATNSDLLREIERGAFRQDLYYRIARYVFQTPPLRERRQDILPIAKHFLGKLLGRESPDFDMHVCDYLLNRTYPGHVRDLHQLMQRVSARYCNSGPITVGDLPEDDRPVPGLFVRA